MIKYLLLGILQGIFEWLPISSEGVISLVGKILIKDLNIIDFAIFLHLGTLFACVFYFWKDLREIIFLRDKKLLRFLLISNFFSLFIGFPLYKTIREIAVGNFLLVIVGTGLLFTAYFNTRKFSKEIDFDKLAIFSGTLQGIAVIPGFSRSGATIFALSFSDLKPEEILKISYIMSIPVVLIATIYLYFENTNFIFNYWPTVFFSFFTGFLTLKALTNLSKKINFSRFVLIFSLLCFLGSIINIIDK